MDNKHISYKMKQQYNKNKKDNAYIKIDKLNHHGDAKNIELDHF